MTFTVFGTGAQPARQHRRSSRTQISLVLILLIAALAAQATAQVNRINSAITSGGLVTMSGSAHPAASRLTDLGSLDSQITLGSLSLHFAPSAAQQKDLDELLVAQHDPKSPNYHQWLTQEEYAARFGMSDSDLAAVSSWLEGQGFTVTSVSKSRNAIRFQGKVAQVESTFHTQLHRFLDTDGSEHFANTTDVQLPATLANVTAHVRGLHNFRPKPSLRRPSTPSYSVGGTSVSTYLSPGDWATIYNVAPIYSQTCSTSSTGKCDGTGMHVGIIGQTYVSTTDFNNFRAAAQLPSAAGGSTYTQNINLVCIYPKVTAPNSTSCTSSAAVSTAGDQGEADMDVEWAGGVAKYATVDYIYAPYQVLENSDPSAPSGNGTIYGYYDVFDSLEVAIADYTVGGGVVPVLSMSYTACESAMDSTFKAYLDIIGAQANAQGQSILISSGDTGAFGCDAQSSYPAKAGVYPALPNDAPYFTSVGGTTLSGDINDQSTYWNTSSPSTPLNPGTAATAKSYIPELAWNDTVARGSLSASGGGVSTWFSLPTWQAGLVTGVTGRMQPDVAFASSPENDGYLICSSDLSSTYGTDCAYGFWTSLKLCCDVYGGTSAASPSFAGMLTVLVQKYGKLGNVNQILYPLAAKQANYTTGLSGAIFHVIGASNTTVLCNYTANLSKNTDPGCPVGGSFGYAVSTTFPYYNMATGLGSIDGYQLFQALGSSALATTTTSVSASPSTVTIGGTTALTATVTSTTSGTITGTVTFKAGSTTLGSATISSGTATLTGVTASTANGFAVGSNTITASYAGDSTFAASSGTTAVTVNPLPATTTTASASPSTVTIGGTTALTATVTSTTSGTITGSVTFTVGSTTLGSATLSGGTATLNGVAVTTAHGFAVGSNTITASYAGDTYYAASSNTTALTVNSLPTPTVSVTPSPSPVTVGATETIGVVVSGSVGTPTGTVTVKVGTTTLQTSQALTSGSYSFTVAATTANGFAIGSNTITATYAGDSNYATNSGTASLTVNQVTTTTSVSASVTPASYGASETLTATVTPSTATGTVTFKVGTTTLGSGTLSSGVATTTTTATNTYGFAVGSNTITATYAGDTNDAGSSGTASLTVNKATTTTALAVSAASVNYGASEKLTATVTPANATGTVTFYSNGTSLGTGTLASGVATLTSNATTANGYAAGSNSVTAVYAGDTNYTTSTSTASSITVTPTYTIAVSANTKTLPAGSSDNSITVTLTSSGYAGTVTLVPTVTSSNGTASNLTATLSPTSVALTNGGTGSSSLTVAANSSADLRRPARPWKSGGLLVAAIMLAPFTWRRKRGMTIAMVIVALACLGFMVACGGGGGSSTPTKTSTSTSVTASPTTVKLGGTTTLTATVSPAAATGNVSFSIGGTTIGSGAVSSGTATYTATVSTANGWTSGAANTVTATYGGDSSYYSSTGTTSVTVTAPRVYTVTVTPTGSGTVTNPSPVTVTVTVP